MRANGRPLEVGGSVIGFGVPLTQPVLTSLEMQYLDSIKDAWAYALLVALMTTIPLGLFFGGRLSRSVRGLTVAIKAMGQGDLRQVVEVRSQDEMGALSSAFNRMSNDLAGTYEELERSNTTINEQAARLQELSTRDELTGLFNRRELDKQAHRMYGLATRFKHPLAFVMADIDFFKQINDQFSHAVGDRVLRALAGIFRSNTREIDVVGRYGGEEFVIAFPETQVEEAVGLAERLRVAIKEHAWPDIQPGLSVTISMGLSADVGLGSFEQVLEAADRELYRAKDAGRDRVCY
jgi:diguanylate cyclase (GGDEF)-like protein